MGFPYLCPKFEISNTEIFNHEVIVNHFILDFFHAYKNYLIQIQLINSGKFVFATHEFNFEIIDVKKCKNILFSLNI